MSRKRYTSEYEQLPVHLLMLVFRRQILLAFLFVFLSACGKRNSVEHFFVEPVHLGLPPYPGGSIDRSYFASSDSAFVATLTREDSISILNLISGIARTIPIPGGYYDALLMHNKDSLFLFDTRKERMVLCNSSGALVDTFRIPTFDGASHRLVVKPWNKPIVIGNTMYFTVLPYVKLESFYAHDIEYRYDLSSGKGESFVRFPSRYSSTNWWHVVGNQVSRTYNDRRSIVFSFPMSDSIYVFDTDTNTMTAKLAKSNALNNFPPRPYEEEGKRALVEYVATIPMYRTILYDRFRDLYYRVAIHEQNVKNSDGSKNIGIDRPWSIIVLDSRFNVLGEQYFPKRRFIYNYLFVCAEGLCIGDRIHDKPNAIFRAPGSYTLFRVTI